jgi:hypothetical protein
MRVARSPAPLRLALSAAILVQSVGCTAWRVQQVSPSALIEQHHPPRVQVRHADGTRRVLRHPSVEGDSLVSAGRKDTVRVALADVSAVAVRKFSPLKTAGLTALIVGGFFGLACAMTCGFGQVGLGY